MNGNIVNEATVAIKYEESMIFDVLFNKQVAVKKGQTFSLMQQVDGKDTFYGRGGEYQGQQEMVFKVSNSKECKAGTCTDKGQFAAIIYE